MYTARLSRDADAAEFADLAQRCLTLGIPPSAILFATPGAPSTCPDVPSEIGPASDTIPRACAELMEDAVCHRADDRFALLYSVLWRLFHGESELLARTSDPAVDRLMAYGQNVRRDIHRMHAFLRFRPQRIDGRDVSVAWYEPQNFILRRAAPFFVERFAGVDWVVATPVGTAEWRDRRLRFGPAGVRPADLDDPARDEAWLAAYRTSFDPAPLPVAATSREASRDSSRDAPDNSAAA